MLLKKTIWFKIHPHKFLDVHTQTNFQTQYYNTKRTIIYRTQIIKFNSCLAMAINASKKKRLSRISQKLLDAQSTSRLSGPLTGLNRLNNCIIKIKKFDKILLVEWHTHSYKIINPFQNALCIKGLPFLDLPV